MDGLGISIFFEMEDSVVQMDHVVKSDQGWEYLINDDFLRVILDEGAFVAKHEVKGTVTNIGDDWFPVSLLAGRD